MLVVVALVGLPQVLNMLTQVLLMHGAEPEWKLIGVLLTMLLVIASELAAGIAIAWQFPSRRQWFAGQGGPRGQASEAKEQQCREAAAPLQG